MKYETASLAKSESESMSADDAPVEQSGGAQKKSRRATPISIVSTFTVDPLCAPLDFWMSTLGIAAEVTIAPFAQVMQELLNPHSALAQNKTGFDVAVIRLDDWIRDRLDRSIEDNLVHLRRVTDDLITGFMTLRARTGAAILVFFAPPAVALPSAYMQPIEQIQNEALRRLSAISGTHSWTHADLIQLYPVTEWHDAQADEIGRIPYTSEYFAALATLLSRRVTALLKPAYKVIALDCDNTLWKGICGEDGAAGVEITPAHLRFQQLLVRQHDAGMLLCLCSKNNPDDVRAVFRAHSEMPLNEDHLISSRVNWSAKSVNLKALGAELGLGLDSFIFIDDSPMECSEVSTACPQVLALQFPKEAEDISHFLDHVWAFDRIGVTDEGRQRTAQYRQNRDRRTALAEAGSLEQFLASLELRVTISPMQPSQLPRVAELIGRTNQFNLSGHRRTASELEAFRNAGETQILVVHVEDRFGDYGLVGAVLLKRGAASVEADTFVLSCRVLGRGVEHQIVNSLGRLARQEGKPNVVLHFRQTTRNVPARMFLEQSFPQFRASKANGHPEAGSVFTIPTDYAERVGSDAPGSALTEEQSLSTAPVPVANGGSPPTWHDDAYRLSRIDELMREMRRHSAFPINEHSEHVPPNTPLEAAIADIWAELIGVPQISIRASFFDLGGDSLLTVRAIARMGSALGMQIAIHEFFDGPTVEQVAGKLVSSSEVRIAPANRGSGTPLSWSQQRLWFLDQLEGGSAAYHIPLALRLRGELDLTGIQTAFDALVRRHETLRTIFVKAGDVPVQRIVPHMSVILGLVDLTELAPSQRKSEVLQHASKQLAVPFDLGAGPLLRGTLLRLAADEHVLMIVMHHMVSDGWSMRVLIRELGASYEAHCTGGVDPMAPLPIQYADYAHWQRQRLSGRELQQQVSYWREHLQGAPQLLELPTDRSRPPVQTYRGASVPVALDAMLTAELKAFCRRSNLTLAMILYAAWCVLLSRLSGQRDIVVGMPVANRRRTELEDLIGFFVNTLAVRIQLADDPSVEQLLQRVKRIMLAMFANQDAPFEQVVEALQPVRSLSHSPIFQVMFVLQPAATGPLQLPRLTITEEAVPLHTTQFDLSLSLQESGESILGSLNYSSDLFDAETAARWMESFEVLLRALVRQPHLQVSTLPLLSDAQRCDVIERFNATDAEYRRDKFVFQLFEEQVARAPDLVALIHKGQTLTYAQLNAKANQLAHCLRHHGVGPDRLVAICIERGPEMVISLLATLKAGGAYVPLDPSYPAERLKYMVEDAMPVVLLTQASLRPAIPQSTAHVISLDGDREEIERWQTTDLPLHIQAQPTNLAYVIYTSGSTGKPKGVMVEHAALMNFVGAMLRDPGIDVPDCVLGVTTISFDIAAFEIYLPLVRGARLVIASGDAVSDAGALISLMDEFAVTILQATPATWQMLLRAGWRGSPNLKALSGGEALTNDLARELLGRVSVLWNLYGPTETTIYSCAQQILAPGEHPAGEPIGRPISNTHIYILDRHGQPVPVGVGGEIHIAGIGVTRGYLNRPELTSERFLCGPFDPARPERMYRTGDLGRWRRDGTIQYLGRNDHQVKIRGFRIELGEIETQLRRQSNVKEAVVIARDDVPGDKRLVAYLVLETTSAPSIDALRAALKIVLPDYMIPSAFVTLDRLPLTPNGKTDRRALPAPDLQAFATRQYQAPEGEVEQIVANIWQELLRIERVGRNDNFFDLGGHSLLAMQVVARLHSALSIEVPVRLLFEHTTLRELSGCIDNLCTASLLDRMANGSLQAEELLEAVTSMPEAQVEELLRGIAVEDRP